MDEANALKTAAAQKDPTAALESLLCELKNRYNLSDEDIKEARPTLKRQLKKFLKRREKMAELWPDAPAACYIYASFCRPFSEYGRAPESVQAQQHHRADWPALVPHSYIASTLPLELPQVELLRVPLT